jgi:hypothetical protein
MLMLKNMDIGQIGNWHSPIKNRKEPQVKLKILLVVLMVLIPFSVRAAEDSKLKKQGCCYTCVKGYYRNGQYICLRMGWQCPCGFDPTPAVGFHNDIIVAGTWYQRQPIDVMRMSIIPEDVIKAIPKKQKQWFLDLMSKYLPMLILALFGLWIISKTFFAGRR